MTTDADHAAVLRRRLSYTTTSPAERAAIERAIELLEREDEPQGGFDWEGMQR